MADQGIVTAASRPSPARAVPRPLGWAAAFVVLTAIVAATAWAGAWFVPFIVGVAAGVASLRWRGMVVLAVFASVVGWAIPLWVLALRGLPAGATARAIASLAGLPPYAGVTIAATLLLAALQALAGAWLTRALLPRRQVSGA
jgi:hypothetical protein